MKTYNVGFIGFGNVGRALARLFASKSVDLATRYDIEYRVTGIAARRIGWLANADGLDAVAISSAKPDSLVQQLVAAGQISETEAATPMFSNVVDTAVLKGARVNGLNQWLETAKPDVVFETTSLNHETGQPAIDYLKASLRAGAHAITANKGAVVYGFEELSSLAREVGKCFYFESTVADSAPVFSLFRETLPAANLRGFSAALSSTCSIIIETMEAGRSFDEGVKTAQELGVTETDPSNDVDGWDSTVKVCALARVLMNAGLLPKDVKREGIRGLSAAMVQRARGEGKPFKLIARAQKLADGSVVATVKPEQVALTDPLGNIRGTSLAVHFELDMMPGLTITSHRPNLQSTAYGLLADFVNAVRRGGAPL